MVDAEHAQQKKSEKTKSALFLWRVYGTWVYLLCKEKENLYLFHGSCSRHGPLPEHPFFWVEQAVVLHGLCGGTRNPRLWHYL